MPQSFPGSEFGPHLSEQPTYLGRYSGIAFSDSRRILGAVCTFVSLFPWVGFGLFDLDSQPWPALMWACYLCSGKEKRVRIPRSYRGICCAMAIGVAWCVINSADPFSFSAARGVFNYASFLIIFAAFFDYLSRYGFPKQAILIGMLIWIAAIPLEIYFPEVREAIAARRTDESRGLTSLAAEPTYFAIYLYFSYWLIHLNETNRTYRLIALAVTLSLIAFAAKSLMGMAFLLITGTYLGLYSVLRRQYRRITIVGIILLIPVFFAFLWILPHLPDGNRIVFIVLKITESDDLLNLVLIDESINQRLEAVVFSIHGAVRNIFIPGGFDTFVENRNSLLPMYEGLFGLAPEANKIMSWVGDFIYCLGIFGAISIVLLANSVWDKTRRGIVEISLLFIILLSAVPIAFPLIPMLFAVYSDKKIKRRIGRDRVKQEAESTQILAL